MKRSAKQRLDDIIGAATEIIENCPKTRDQLSEDRILQLGLVKLTEIIGEAANHVGDELQLAHPEVPWRAVIGMRHRTVHSYFEIDFSVLWKVISEEIPVLLPQIVSIRATLDQDPSSM
ncbi:HepT-like ribonuclease domain-containing protein [Actinoalloteichus hymeniacidonis]|uniref:DUF86 domain-containing protein n=1 Tax=Actinoalloteichus hymeniacidonis TaxID=340345 RepID=A0AAC9MZK6_9PSEU|nr:HepT-like ribonuclease domain-containing protein [Actinoalloteichus hymeniacidonis]AOS65503.1 hypothetical protein TL08_23615 [Actinoalloteichus hymeniacidonis]MBB5906410.1 uncharacterized protein with HEPN domain [Actinoalloteichus hymeniacidonis]